MSMLRNVLTYMGLGPDEDYDDGYLYESTESDEEPVIDLTDDDPAPAPVPVTASESILGDGADPHAQRERPDWLAELGDDGDSLGVGALTAGSLAAAAGGLGDELGSGGGSGRRKISIDDDDPDATGPGWSPTVPSGEPRPLRAIPPTPPSPDAEGVAMRDLDPAPDDAEESGSEVRIAAPRALTPTSFGDAKELADEFMAGGPVVMDLRAADRELARRLIDFASGICYAREGGMEKLARQVFLLVPAEVDVSAEERARYGADPVEH